MPVIVRFPRCKSAENIVAEVKVGYRQSQRVCRAEISMAVSVVVEGRPCEGLR